MAAKSPKPSGPLLKQSSQNSSNSIHNSNSSNSSNSNTPTTPTAKTTSVFNAYSSQNNYVGENNAPEEGAVANVSQRTSCSCTNISIMHLFHEMKQEFPTIPDQIVAQCVNENCHQRDNCIQTLRNELALNPIPVQTYPAKVLQQHHQNHQQRQQHQNNQPQQQQQQPQPPTRLKFPTLKPVTPLKPIRAAPTQPPTSAALHNANFEARRRADGVKHHATNAVKTNNCDSVKFVNNNNNNNSNNPINNIIPNNNSVNNGCNSDTNCNSIDELEPSSSYDMPATAETPSTTTRTQQVNEVSSQPQHNFSIASNFINKASVLAPTSTSPLATRPPRARPNTLNLQAPQQQQQLQRQQLKIQLQQHFQQRSNSQAQTVALSDTPLQRPIRKAPLPPIAPKPVFSFLNHSNNINNSNNNCNYNNNQSANQNCNSPQSQSSGYSNESNVTSPLSSCAGESEISVNVSLSSPTAAAASVLNSINNRKNISANNNSNINLIGDDSSCETSNYQTQPLKSPVRHCSVITVQPEPPYARDFLLSSKTTPTTETSTGCGVNCNSTATTPTGGQKSFTSVNLTLRQPNSAVPQSTIDISAGPALSGNGSGLTYSSTSYDARRGYQKNFHITVTDEGGVFNASRIRPRSAFYTGEAGHEQDELELSNEAKVNVLGATQSSAININGPISPTLDSLIATQDLANPILDEMCLPREIDGFSEIIKRQKTRRDKLATALRENKKKLGHVEEEINMLTEPVQPGKAERLDSEIEKLRSDCQFMLNEIENIRRYGPNHICEAERHRQIQLQLQQRQQQQQSFPHNQRSTRTPTSSMAQSPSQQSDLDFVQHHGAAQIATSAIATNMAHPQRTPSQQQQQLSSCVDDDASDSTTEDSIEEEMWACVMCTFRNHPQLNICECCENCRILPGTIRFVPKTHPQQTTTPSTAATSNAAVLEHDTTNLTQQQQQQQQQQLNQCPLPT